MYRAGIDLGGTNIKAGIVDENQRLVAQASVPTEVERPYQEVIKDMADLVTSLLQQKEIAESELAGIGIGSPGMIDAVQGVVVYSNNFGWENAPESILNQLCEGNMAHMNGKIPFDAVAQGDKTAEQVVSNYITYLGETITNFVNIFRPDVILLSGGVCNQGENLTVPLQEYIKGQCFAGEKAYIPKVVCATLGNEAGMIGAANLL